MNILIPHHWLLDHLETAVKPEELARCLSLCGPSVERIHQIKGQAVYDIEVTTNRVDMMSVRGIAREAAAILPEFGHKAVLKPLSFQKITEAVTGKAEKPLDIVIKNPNHLSRRIMAIKLSHVPITASPKYIQERLTQVGQRPLNNVIDITNYVMWDLGHPIHAFDYDKITTKTILIREAQKGETLTTLDNKAHTLKGGEVVFDDGTGTIIDLPGIMGTANTVISDQTTTVLFWIESIDARKIRNASMKLQIRSQAAILNEKHVDPNLASDAIMMAVKTLTETTPAKIDSKLTDIYPQPVIPQKTLLKSTQLETYLGIEIDSKRVSRIITNLGCTVTSNAGQFEITPPTFRSHDLKLPVDYIEEIARIYGYHNLESQLMATPIPDNPSPEQFGLESSVKNWLAGWGATEVYTYSMISKKLALQSGLPLSDHLELKNAYSEDWTHLRRSLIPSLAAVFAQNPTRTTTVFELQNVYHPTKNHELPQEVLTLALLTNRSFLHFKGIIDALMAKFHVEDYHIKPASPVGPFASQKTGEILTGKTTLGTLGALTSFPYWGAEINFRTFANAASLHPTHIPSFPFSPIIEDLTFTLPSKTHLGPVIATVQRAHPLIQTVSLKSTYKANATFSITYQDRKRQLTDQDITPVRALIVSKLKEDHQAKLVGTLIKS
jgi:phenylalanyl-tRNA synthetase beta chain